MQNKPKFIETISEIGGITKKEAGNILELTIAAIQQACKEDGGVKITGVGEIVVKDVAEKCGNMNGKEWHTPATKTLKAKISKSFVKDTLEV